MELSKDKRPTDDIIFNGTSDDLDDWLDRVLNVKHSDGMIVISDIEG